MGLGPEKDPSKTDSDQKSGLCSPGEQSATQAANREHTTTRLRTSRSGEFEVEQEGDPVALNQYYSVSRGGVHLTRSHPRASEIRRKLKALNRTLAELVSGSPVSLTTFPEPSKKVPKTPHVASLTGGVGGRNPAAKPWDYEESQGLQTKGGRELRPDHYKVIEPETVVQDKWDPDRDVSDVARRWREVAEKFSPLSKEADDSDTSSTAGARRDIPVPKVTSNDPRRGNKGFPPASEPALPNPSAPKEKRNTFPKGGLGPAEDLAKVATNKRFRTCQTDYSDLRRRYPGVGLFHNPRTSAEKSLKKAYLGLLAKHSCEGASFLPVYYRTHPRSLPEARVRAKERRERRRLAEVAACYLAHPPSGGALRRLERASRPGGHPAHKRTALIKV